MVAAAAFFETQVQLAAVLERGPAALVALTPEADHAAEARGLDYTTIEDHYDDAKLSGRSLEQIESLCAAIDAHVGEPRFSAAQHFLSLKVLADVLDRHVLALTSALDRLTPETVICFETSAARIGDDLVAWDESLAAKTLAHLGRARGLEVVQLPDAETVPSEPAAATARASGLRLRARRLVLRAGSGFRRSAAGRTLAVTSLHPDRHVLDAWERAGGALRVVDFGVDAEPDEVPWAAVAADVRPFFAYDGVDCFPVVEERLRHLVAYVRPRQLAAVDAATASLRDLAGPVLLGTAPVLIEHIATHVAARELAIPAAVHQHGGMLGYVDYPLLRYTDVEPADVFLCYGEGVSHAVPEGRGQTRVVGSSALDALRRREPPPAGLRVVYVVSSLPGDTRYAGNHTYPDIWYWRLQRSVVEALEGADLTVQLWPGREARNPLADLIDAPRDRRLTELLEKCDVVVIDVPSTGLLEALAAGRRVVAFSDRRWIPIREDAAEQLRACASLTTEPEDFLAQLQELARGRVPGDDPDARTAFLREYGTAADDGRSAERAVRALLDLAGGP